MDGSLKVVTDFGNQRALAEARAQDDYTLHAWP